MVELIAHRPEWEGEFQGLETALRSTLGPLALRIDHIGSTSVPALCAKDVIDVQVTVAALDEARVAMRAAGFTEHPDVQRDHVPPGYEGSEDDWRKALFTQRKGDRRANLHIRVQGSPNQRYALLFRDYLRTRPDTAQAYGELKRRLAGSLANADDYPDVKDPAVDLIYLPAEEWAARTGWKL